MLGYDPVIVGIRENHIRGATTVNLVIPSSLLPSHKLLLLLLFIQSHLLNRSSQGDGLLFHY